MTREKDWWFALLIFNATPSGKMKQNAQEFTKRSSPQIHKMHMSKDVYACTHSWECTCTMRLSVNVLMTP